jgi:uncharacterized protein YjbI with pentapeptide repeats
MTLRDQGTMTRLRYRQQKRYCGLTLREIFQFISSLLLPLVLGVFTVIITVHQQNVASRQRFEDRILAQEQREQDLNISREQRLQDLNMSAWQREQDLNISRDQRIQDKDIAEAKRVQDDLIAEKQRNISEQQRAHELSLAQSQLRDSLLVTYMNDIGMLLKMNNGTLTNDPLTAILARAKTVTAIQQLDSPRNTYLIRFLYEAKQLTTGANPLDLSDAELDGIDFSSETIIYRKLCNLSLPGALLRNASFSKRDLSYANFSGANLDGAQFLMTKMNNADLSGASIVRTDLSSANLEYTRFDHVHSRRTQFRFAQVANATFFKSSLLQAVFISSNCVNASFHSADLEHADFTKANLKGVVFINANLLRTNFSGNNLNRMDFHRCRLNGANFTKSSCEGAIFQRVELNGAYFSGAKLKDTDFSFAGMNNIDFVQTDLSLATFSQGSLTDANFNKADVTMANFSFTKMSKLTQISNEQLLSAASVRGALLPNGSIINEDPNLLRNGDAHCTNPLLEYDWQIQPPGAIVISTIANNISNCVFISLTNTTSNMSQDIDLRRYVALTSRYRAVVVLSARVGDQSILIWINDHKGRQIGSTNSTQGK